MLALIRPLPLLALLLLAGSTVPAHSAPTGTITGSVVDSFSGKPLISANVIIVGTSQVTSTDHKGEFTLEHVHPGTLSLRASMVGYDPQTITDIHLVPGAVLEISFELESCVIELEEVILTYEKPILVAGVTSQACRYGPPSSTPPSRTRPAPGLPGYNAPQPNHYAPPGREDFSEWEPNAWMSAWDQPLSTFSVDVDNAAYTRSRKYILNGIMPPPESVRIEEFINHFDYDYPAPDGDVPFSIITELTECPWNDEHELLHIGLQAKRLTGDAIPRGNWVFLIDVSGSMRPGDKLPRLKRGLLELTRQMRDDDQVAIVTYAGTAGIALPSTAGTERDSIAATIQTLSADGSTAGNAGIELAYQVANDHFIEGGNNRIILCTDGDFNVGVTDLDSLQSSIERLRETGVFLTVVGFGAGNLQHDTMEMLANRGNGSYHYADSEREAARILGGNLGNLIAVVKDVKLQLEFNPHRVAEYRLIGYENRILDHEDFANDSTDAGEMNAGHTVTALYEIVAARARTRNDRHDKASGGLFGALRYQQRTLTETAFSGREAVAVHIRYKLPDSDTSTPLVVYSDEHRIPFDNARESTRFAAAVARFGLMLRNPADHRETSWRDVMTLAQDARGDDPDGERAAFVHVVEEARILASSPVSDEGGGPMGMRSR